MDYIPRPGDGAGMEEKIIGNSVRAVISLRIYGCPYFISAGSVPDSRACADIWFPPGIGLSGRSFDSPGRGGKERNGIIAWREKEYGAGDKKGELPACV